MDTRRCALFLIKCVQGFVAIFRKWMTWKCNFQCISLLFSSFYMLSSYRSCTIDISSSIVPSLRLVCMCKTIGVCMLSRPAFMCHTNMTGYEWACPTFDCHSAQLLCQTWLDSLQNQCCKKRLAKQQQQQQQQDDLIDKTKEPWVKGSFGSKEQITAEGKWKQINSKGSVVVSVCVHACLTHDTDLVKLGYGNTLAWPHTNFHPHTSSTHRHCQDSASSRHCTNHRLNSGRITML